MTNAGSGWTRAELDLIVADYFAMLREEQAGHAYNKTTHRRALGELINRSDSSIEYKHQNISAVLTELGLPIIEGYRPAWNFQGMIFDAIGTYLTRNPDPVPFDHATPTGLAETKICTSKPHQCVARSKSGSAKGLSIWFVTSTRLYATNSTGPSGLPASSESSTSNDMSLPAWIAQTSRARCGGYRKRMGMALATTSGRSM